MQKSGLLKVESGAARNFLAPRKNQILITSIMLFVVVSLIPCASYATVTYTYTGSKFTYLSSESSYTHSDYIYGSVTFASQPVQPPTYYPVNMLSQALSYSFSDSSNSPITQDTPLQPDFICLPGQCPPGVSSRVNYMHFEFSSAGNVTMWEVDLYPDLHNQPDAPYELSTSDMSTSESLCRQTNGFLCDYAQTGNDNFDDYAYNTTTSGTWTTTVNDDVTPAPVPEPATIFLFVTGLAGLAGTRRRRKKSA